jgi:hypothetical protein
MFLGSVGWQNGRTALAMGMHRNWDIEGSSLAPGVEGQDGQGGKSKENYESHVGSGVSLGVDRGKEA